jgi:hypothetical protein
MLELELPLILDDHAVAVQDEPALEIALPQVFLQPPLTRLQRGRLPHVEGLVSRVFRHHQADPTAPLGPDYQELAVEFQPLFDWTLACWDYLLSTEGCRFVPRQGEQRCGARGDYRAVTDRDYSRMVHRIFRACVLEFARRPEVPSLSQWLRERMWPLTVDAYRRLAYPPDPRQRLLTPYSYLRCVPYRFLNEFHHELASATLRRLPEAERRVLEVYFLQFYTEAACAEALSTSMEHILTALRRGLLTLLLHDRLVYCLLRQIERY